MEHTTDAIGRQSDSEDKSGQTGPDPALKRLDVLSGTWKLHGATADDKKSEITGEMHGEWILGGYFMKLSATIRFEGMAVEAIQIVGYDPDTDTFPAPAFGKGGSKSIPYTIAIKGKTFEHRYEDATYHGRISDDGNVIKGGWRPHPGVKPNEGNNYDMTMTRLR